MKESYVKGLANNNGPEPCAGARKGDAEAFTGERAVRVLSREDDSARDADPAEESGSENLRAASARHEDIPRGQRAQPCTLSDSCPTEASPGRALMLAYADNGNAS